MADDNRQPYKEFYAATMERCPWQTSFTGQTLVQACAVLIEQKWATPVEVERLRIAASILAKLAAAEAWQISTEGEVFVQVDYNLFNQVPLDETELAFLAALTEGTSEQ